MENGSSEPKTDFVRFFSTPYLATHRTDEIPSEKSLLIRLQFEQRMIATRLVGFFLVFLLRRIAHYKNKE